jgi:hypothetical protein
MQAWRPHFDEEQDPDLLDPHQSEERDRDPHQRDSDPQPCCEM